jgi:hypothetical protein
MIGSACACEVVMVSESDTYRLSLSNLLLGPRPQDNDCLTLSLVQISSPENKCVGYSTYGH